MAFLKKIFTFLAKKCPFSENFWDLSGLSQICNKIFKNFLTPPPLKIFFNPYPPPKIFGQAHVWIRADNNNLGKGRDREEKTETKRKKGLDTCKARVAPTCF